jgi:hypothetical protein
MSVVKINISGKIIPFWLLIVFILIIRQSSSDLTFINYLSKL